MEEQLDDFAAAVYAWAGKSCSGDGADIALWYLRLRASEKSRDNKAEEDRVPERQASLS